VYDDTIDDADGIVIRSEILMAASRDEWGLPMRDFKKPVIILPASANVDEVLELFLEERQQFALVQDEFGGTAGVVTMEDVLETLLGEEIVDELDEVDDMRELAREQAELTD
jgi:CBS domain containing-hemolysin-like protein